MIYVLRIIMIVILGFSVASYSTSAANPPSASADQAILIEAESGRVLYEKNAHDEQKIASITKIMTAHLAIKYGDLEEMVKISSEASITEGSSLYLKAGQKVSLNDLVYGLMLRSGNDAAVAIAEHISGTVEEFSKLMNKEAKEIGMENSNFTNPHGLDLDDVHYSSSFDMAILTQEAMKDDTFASIFGTTNHKAESIDPSPVWRNKHRLVNGLYPHATGGKTGYTKQAGRTLVTVAERDGMELIVVTIRASNDWNDHMSLFEYGFENYKMETILQPVTFPPLPGQAENEYYTVTDAFRYPVTEEEESLLVIESKISNNRKDPPTVLVKLDQEIIHEQTLIKEIRKDSSWWSRLINRLSFW
ncbi:D-alanyl-D-alanine carboxypeptidase family protein [Jeotgalibacillus marinus]|uniref:D-alanyl-D-alanine carboxypeptidase family protein n=1 Tax=Jeotgalibacillus marinus TaxID=86667 RepID=A0ABV3PYZ4_9BACL